MILSASLVVPWNGMKQCAHPTVFKVSSRVKISACLVLQSVLLAYCMLQEAIFNVICSVSCMHHATLCYKMFKIVKNVPHCTKCSQTVGMPKLTWIRECGSHLGDPRAKIGKIWDPWGPIFRNVQNWITVASKERGHKITGRCPSVHLLDYCSQQREGTQNYWQISICPCVGLL